MHYLPIVYRIFYVYWNTFSTWMRPTTRLLGTSISNGCLISITIKAQSISSKQIPQSNWTLLLWNVIEFEYSHIYHSGCRNQYSAKLYILMYFEKTKFHHVIKGSLVELIPTEALIFIYSQTRSHWIRDGDNTQTILILENIFPVCSLIQLILLTR